MKDQEKKSDVSKSDVPVLAIVGIALIIGLSLAVIITASLSDLNIILIAGIGTIGIAFAIATTLANNKVGKLKENVEKTIHPLEIIEAYFNLLLNTHDRPIFEIHLPHNALCNLPARLMKDGAGVEVLEMAIASLNSDEKALMETLMAGINRLRPHQLRHLLAKHFQTLIKTNTEGVDFLLHAAVNRFGTVSCPRDKGIAQEIIEILAFFGVNRSIPDSSGKTPLALFKELQECAVQRALDIIWVLDPDTPIKDICDKYADKYTTKATADKDDTDK